MNSCLCDSKNIGWSNCRYKKYTKIRECRCRKLRCYEKGYFFGENTCKCPKNAKVICKDYKCKCVRSKVKKFNGEYKFENLISEKDPITSSFNYRKASMKFTVDGKSEERKVYINDQTGSFKIVKKPDTTLEQDKQEESVFTNPSDPNAQTVQTTVVKKWKFYSM